MGEEKSKKTDIIPIVIFICFVSVILLLMLFMLFALYYRAFDAIVEGKIPIDKLDLKMSDGFIGATATLIGIMVTFAIGYQIVNAIQIKEDVDYIKNDVLSKVEHIQVDFKTLESKLQYDIAVSNLDNSFELNNPLDLYNDNVDIQSIINLMFALKQFFDTVESINDAKYIKSINNYLSIQSMRIKQIIKVYISYKNNIIDNYIKDDFFDENIKYLKSSKTDNQILLLYISAISKSMKEKDIKHMIVPTLL